MSRLTDLLQQARGLDPKLAAELEREIRHSQNQRSFGLVFERHLPDAVELPTRPVRRGDTVYILPPRGSKKAGDKTLWTVAKIDRKAEGGHSATLIETKPAKDSEAEVRDGVLVEDLVVVAQHDDTIYPGLVQTGEVINSDDPETSFHTVINSENLHALNLLTYTHRHKVDCIYIDPPYNTRDKDWKYNNDYVDGDDQYKHSKWLSMMEKRLEIAKELLNPEDSVLIVTIDEKEYLRLGMLLEQTFPEARIQMVSSVISQRGTQRDGAITRVDEYIFYVQVGNAKLSPARDDFLGSVAGEKKRQMWFQYRRNGKGSLRVESPGSFFPLVIDPSSNQIVEIGDALPPDMDRNDYVVPDGLEAVFPLREDGTEARWRTAPVEARKRWAQGFIRVGAVNEKTGLRSVMFVNEGGIKAVENGEIQIVERMPDGSAVFGNTSGWSKSPKSVWNQVRHDAGWHGSKLLSSLVPIHGFDYPKSLYLVEDTLSLVVSDKPHATVLDFFAGSGTTAHAVMRLNKQDGGKRRSISVTNNEVSFEEAKKLKKEGYRPGDPEWEQWGICDYVTKPRIDAAISGKTRDGDPIKGDYKFTDEFPMADGFEANARFFTLTYEPPTRVRHGLAFAEIAPLLWLRAGQFGRVIESIPDRGWDVAESHGAIKNVAAIDTFAEAVREMETVTTVYVITDDALTFQSAVAKLADIDVEVVQLYSTYLTNFAFTQSGGGI